MPRVYEKKPMLGRRFGRWTVIGTGPGCAWQCRCDCGRERAVQGASLRVGRSASCGCLNVEMARARRIAWNKRRPPRALKDLVGQLFGRLSVLEYLGGKKLRWRCKCVCGKEALVPRASLTSGDARSCGCLKRELVTARNLARAFPPEQRAVAYRARRRREQEQRKASGYDKRPEVAARRRQRDAARQAAHNRDPRHAAAVKKYQATEKGRATQRKILAKRRGAMGPGVTARQWNDLCEAFGRRCAYCGCAAKLTEDHVRPVSKGGADDLHNVLPACRKCNTRKSFLDLKVWLSRSGMNEADVAERIRRGYAVILRTHHDELLSSAA